MPDPATLSILLRNLVPIIGMLAFFSVPVGIIWLLKSHKLRMRELDIEEKALLSRGAEARLQSLEQRLGALEAAITGAPAPKGLEHRAALLEGPAVSEPARLKQR
jgi:hypothetical protein